MSGVTDARGGIGGDRPGPPRTDDEEALPAAERRLLQQRAERLRAPAAAPQDDRHEWVAEWAVGADRFAVPLAQVLLALPLRLVTPVPLSPRHVVGIVRHQGRAVTVLSLSALVGGHGFTQDPAVLVILDVGGGRVVAIDCEQVPKPAALPAAEVAAARARGEPVAQVAAPAGVVHLLDMTGLLERVEGA